MSHGQIPQFDRANGLPMQPQYRITQLGSHPPNLPVPTFPQPDFQQCFLGQGLDHPHLRR
jgi:hypothetical protein